MPPELKLTFLELPQPLRGKTSRAAIAINAVRARADDVSVIRNAHRLADKTAEPVRQHLFYLSRPILACRGLRFKDDLALVVRSEHSPLGKPAIDHQIDR